MKKNHQRIRRGFAAALITGLSGALFICSHAVSQNTTATTTTAKDPYIAVISTDGAYLRSGAAKTYYPMVQFQRGDLVEVVGEKNRWGRIRIDGPALSQAQGFVIYPTNESGHLRLAADGKTAVALGQLPVYARNLNTTDPSLCWKRICNVKPNQSIEIIETTTVDGGGGAPDQIAHRIRLPQQAEGWVSTAFISPANEAEVAIWRASLAAPNKALTTTTVAKDAPKISAPTTPSSTPSTVVAKQQQPTVAKTNVPETTAPVVAAPVATLPTPTPMVTTTPEKLVEAKPTPAAKELASLEDRFQKIRNTPASATELLPLRNLYAQFVAESPNSPEAQYATLRIEQLSLWSDLQERRQAIAALRNSTDTAANHNSSIRLALANGGDYVAVGRLEVSTIFDGDQLPRLYRLQDPSNGRTLAYIVPQDDISLTMMLGQLIGINGKKSYDSGLRLELIEPQRIDVLAPQQ